MTPRLTPAMLLLWATALLPLPARAQAGVDAGSVLQLAGALVLVIGAIFASAWLVRRVGHPAMTGGGPLKVVASLSLGTRERVVLVQVGEQQVLLGVSSQGINHLHSFDQPVFDPQEAHHVSDFSRKLRDIMLRGTAQPKE